MRGTPIVIEPKHIRGTPSLNIVNNNWIDCVTIEENQTEMVKTSVFQARFGIYEEMQPDYPPPPFKNFKLIVGENQYLPYKYLTVASNLWGAGHPFLYYRITIENTHRTTKSLMGLESLTEMRFLYVERKNQKAEIRTRYFTEHSGNVLTPYSSFAEFENKYISGNSLIARPPGEYAIGFIYKPNTIDIAILVSQTEQDGFEYLERHPVFHYNFNIFLYTLKSEKKTLRYRLNSAGQCVLAEDSFKAKYPYTHPSNELIQSTATALNKYNNNAREPLSKVIAHSILYQWKKGKMTARMEVLNIQYYDINGNLAIDIKNPAMKQLFKPCDWVIPYIVEERDGEMVKVPLSKKRNGEPRVFEICSAEFRYDGGEMTQYLKMTEVID